MPSQEMPTAGHLHSDKPEDHGPVVSAVLWFFLAVTILSVIGRTATKSTYSRGTTRENLLISIALLFSVAQSIAVSFEVWNGLGQHANRLTSVQLEKFQQSSYASSLLLVPTLAFTKISLLPLFYGLTSSGSRKTFLTAFAVVLALWALASELVTAFQCSLLHPWNINNTCISRSNFWTSFGILNILTELPLIILPLLIAGRVQASTKGRVFIAGPFAARTLLIPPIIASLVFLNRSASTQDQSFDPWPVVVCNQVVQNLGIITACVPYLKPFMQNLEPCIATTDDVPPHGVGDIEQGRKSNEAAPGAGLALWGFFSKKDGKGSRDEVNDTSGGNKGPFSPAATELMTVTVLMKENGVV